jgi:hypothetical protein
MDERLRTSMMATTMLIRRLRKKETPMPSTITVEEINPPGRIGKNLVSHDRNRHTLQMKLTLIKNNKFCISGVSCKIALFCPSFSTKYHE